MVGFDLDGTLVDSNRDIAPSINHALREIGRPEIPAEKTRYLIGGGAMKMLGRAFELTGGPLPEDVHEHAFQLQQAFYEAHIADLTVPYDGCLTALEQLAERGASLAVITNKKEHFAKKLLRELGMADRFACILGGDSLGPGRDKPAPDLLHEAMRLGAINGRFAMVGDSSFDTRAARAAEVPVVLVSFGYNDMPHDQMDHDALIDHFDELVPALESL